MCAPLVMMLALGTVAMVEIVDARAGLEAATQAAAAEAASAPDPVSAQRAARERFASVIADYPVHSAVLQLTFGGFNRTDVVSALSSGQVEVFWPAPSVGRALNLESKVTIPLEPWRSHAKQP